MRYPLASRFDSRHTVTLPNRGDIGLQGPALATGAMATASNEPDAQQEGSTVCVPAKAPAIDASLLDGFALG